MGFTKEQVRLLNTFVAENDLDMLRARIAELEAELVKRIDFMAREGYRRCDIAACNCGSWHGGNAVRRLTEIRKILDEHAAEKDAQG